jgi:hypothetical protein
MKSPRSQPGSTAPSVERRSRPVATFTGAGAFLSARASVQLATSPSGPSDSRVHWRRQSANETAEASCLDLRRAPISAASRASTRRSSTAGIRSRIISPYRKHAVCDRRDGALWRDVIGSEARGGSDRGALSSVIELPYGDRLWRLSSCAPTSVAATKSAMAPAATPPFIC